MFSLDTLRALEASAEPCLTWYGQARTELVGSNVARWISKCAGAIYEFADEQAHVAVAMPPSWQALMWLTGTGFTEGTALWFANPAHVEPAEFEVIITDNADWAKRWAAADPGLVVALHDLSPMALGWTGELPAGVVDAIAQTHGQPDQMEFLPAPVCEVPQENEPENTHGNPVPSTVRAGKASAGLVEALTSEVAIFDATAAPNPRGWAARILSGFEQNRRVLWVGSGWKVGSVIEQEGIDPHALEWK
ncbi:hypothetical protein QS713_04550 [Gleimia hominis]|uniref:TIGR03089 family protein n=1 Tax=Gleimia hominis TaxID=595468 RepID=A0ABU3IAD2_9ACTO|nr:hypothetical protein [Gleimia hominis]MDT3767335.1 hypothetical protein [Gleimia hominis]